MDHLKWFRGTGAAVPSYRDFACYYAAKWLEHGVGIYFDNTFMEPAYNPINTSAYVREDGQIQPSAQVWARREYLRRIWNLHQQMDKPQTPQIMMLHMTNSHVLPYMVWNEANLDLEWKLKDARPLQEKFSPALLRAESLGLKTGNYPMAMVKPRNRGKPEGMSEEEYRFRVRTHRAGMYVHDIKYSPNIQTLPTFEAMTEFGYGHEDCRVINYWEDDPPVTMSDEQCKWLLMERDGELMLLLCTWNPQSSTVELTIDNAALGLEPTQAHDAESGEQLTMSGNTVTVPMRGYGVRIIKLDRDDTKQ